MQWKQFIKPGKAESDEKTWKEDDSASHYNDFAAAVFYRVCGGGIYAEAPSSSMHFWRSHTSCTGRSGAGSMYPAD